MNTTIFKMLFLHFLFLNSFVLFSQEVEKLDPNLQFSYYKYTDNSKALKAKLMARDDAGWYPIVGLNVQFYSVTDSSEILLAEMETNKDGKAQLIIHQDYKLPMDTAGIFKFIARTPETDLYESAEEEIEKKDLFLTLTLSDIDSVRTMVVEAERMKCDGTKAIVTEEDISIFVPRMFTDLKIAEGFIEDGRAEIEFVVSIPGDSLGNIELIARIVDHDDYGTVESRVMSNWAIPVHKHLREHPTTGELWTPIAPLWMIITLILMLAGVWGHYIYAMIQLVLIKKEIKKDK
ncbi:MAG: hypothetical protein K9J13_15635 [Saprospiraceae bacterium]|nr:hypothetical protein [Saprospiraceae bacterium]